MDTWYTGYWITNQVLIMLAQYSAFPKEILMLILICFNNISSGNIQLYQVVSSFVQCQKEIILTQIAC